MAGATLLPVETFLALLAGGWAAMVGGLLSGVLTAWLGARRDKRRRHTHEQKMAREARAQERLAQTYVELHTSATYETALPAAAAPATTAATGEATGGATVEESG